MELYKIVKNNNTFVLNFSEVPDECYYSNRVPILLGYSSLVIQEKFRNIENYFSSKEIIIYSNMEELKTKVTNLIKNFDKQNIMRTNALKCSKKYSFDNYVFEILDKMTII